MTKRNLDERVAVVTGAASGIGRAIAQNLADKGCHLALVDVNEAGLEETRSTVARNDRRCTTHIADVSDKARMQALPDEVAAAHGQVHILVNNAGVSVGSFFADHSIEDAEWVIGVNLWGVVYGCKFFLPHLKQADWAQIVNISSLFGFFGMPGQACYSMTKAAVKALSEALWTELANTSVSVTSVHPGVIRVEMADKYGLDPDKVGRLVARAIERKQRRLIVGGDARAAHWFTRALPNGFHSMLTFAFRKANVTGMQS
ncbi:MAG: SDR family oxidoreductase [Deltaproteobacteria bacterium]|nr:SDR family oxidoreductase [Deltaproteobacteria bacterium]